MDIADRVRAHSAPEANLRIDQQIAERIRGCAGATDEELTRRIDALDREWDIERFLETNASVLALTGLVLGLTRDRRWFALPAIVLPFLFQHAVQGWCPPLPLLRRAGIRTRAEISRERYAMKALRGDFGGAMTSRPELALAAVDT